MLFYSEGDLRTLGLKDFGERVRISRQTSIYGAENIAIGSDVRIDDFCVISAGEGGITLGSFIHIAVFSSLIGGGRICMEDFSGLSSRVSVYSSSDDYSGEWMTNPTVPGEFRGITQGDVLIGKHVIVGAGSVILPGVTLEEGVAVGALTLVRKRCREFGVYFGSPAKRVAERKRNLLELEARFKLSLATGPSNDGCV